MKELLGLLGILTVVVFLFTGSQVNMNFWNWLFVVLVVALFSFLYGASVGNSQGQTFARDRAAKNKQLLDKMVKK